MKRVPAVEHSVYEWPYQPTSEDKKQTPEEMIRSLQGVFCKGRYHSWVFSREKPLITTTLGPSRGGRK